MYIDICACISVCNTLHMQYIYIHICISIYIYVQYTHTLDMQYIYIHICIRISIYVFTYMFTACHPIDCIHACVVYTRMCIQNLLSIVYTAYVYTNMFKYTCLSLLSIHTSMYTWNAIPY